VTDRDDQPVITFWPGVDIPPSRAQWDEPSSKITAAIDIVQARYKLAKRFNRRPPAAPPAVRELEIERSWEAHRKRPHYANQFTNAFNQLRRDVAARTRRASPCASTMRTNS
jgi:hypothetical protein